MQSGKIRLSILVLIIANIAWGAAFPIYKWTLEIIPPFTFGFLRFFLASIILFPFVYKSLNLNRQNFPKLFLLGLVSVTFLIPFLMLGLKLSPSINAPIIISSGPIILIISSILFLKEKVTPKLLTGTLISLAGVLAIILRPIIDSGFNGAILGSFFIFLATVSSVAQALVLKKLSPDFKPLVLTFWMFFLGSLPLLPLVFLESGTFSISDINLQAAIGLFYGVIVAGAVCHFFFSYGISNIKASEVGIFSYVDPLATIFVAVPLLHEKITSTYLLGAFLVFVGIFIAEGRIHYHPIHRLFR